MTKRGDNEGVGRGRVVMIVDDFQDARELMGDLLRHWGFEVIECADGSEAILAAILVTNRRAALLWAMAGVLGFVIVGVVIERSIVTEREQVEKVMDGIMSALNHNDLDRLLRDYVAPDAAKTRGRAVWALNRIEIERASYHNLRVTVNRLTSPVTAEAEFNGTVYYDDRLREFPYRSYAARFRVELELRDGHWLVTDHVEYDFYGTERQDERF